MENLKLTWFGGVKLSVVSAVTDVAVNRTWNDRVNLEHPKRSMGDDISLPLATRVLLLTLWRACEAF